MATADLIETGPVAGGQKPVIVYILPFCARSIATTRDLAQHGVDFEEIDLSGNPQARARVEALGYMRAPVVVYAGEHWAGYNPEAIARIAAKKRPTRPIADFRKVDVPVTPR